MVNDRCHIDPAAVREWLTTRHGIEHQTMAGGLGIDEYFHGDDADSSGILTRLFEAAQADGQFGLTGHRVELWHVVDDQGDRDGHLLVVRSDNGVGYASGQVPFDHLVDFDLAGVDAAVSALENAAVIVNEVLDGRRNARAISRIARGFTDGATAFLPASPTQSAHQQSEPRGPRR